MLKTNLTSALVISIFLVSCANTPTNDKPAVRPQTKEITESNIQSLLNRASSSSQARGFAYRLQAVDIALKNRDLDQAENILRLIEKPNDRKNAQKFAILHVKIALQKGDPRSALKWLDHSDTTGAPLTQQLQIELGELRSQSYFLNRSFIASARERIFFDALLSPEEKKTNHEKIYSTLMELSASTLTKQAQKAITSDLRGWLSLTAMSKANQNNPLAQLQELQRWKLVWSYHPAVSLLPESLEVLSKVVAEKAKSIALFLPMQGNLGTYGRAIRDGIIAANYQLDPSTITKLQVYDTSSRNLPALLDDALQNGAELIIGPLERKKVTSLVKMKNLPIPVLALNRSLSPNTHINLFQFGLAPEDEMVQVAEQVFKEGKRNVLAIYPDSDWGTRNFEAFRQQWSLQGGNIIARAAYQNQKDYSVLIKSLLNVDRSEQRSKDLRRIIGKRFEFKPRRRQDIDFVLLLGNQSQARGIKPILDFHYAEDIPVYSTSHINESNDSTIESMDLNGIRFCDIPWKLSNSDPLQLSVQSTWESANSSLAPFYALGVDAYRLFPRLQQLRELKNSKVYGTTGILTLDKENILRRRLLWAQFSKGQVITSPIILNPAD
ncbi:MAG: penicillin-binding protein activator [Pseudomonadales bacterium]|nr:penicillin-binding protein activator [Pseudomonadales bacterium]